MQSQQQTRDKKIIAEMRDVSKKNFSIRIYSPQPACPQCFAQRPACNACGQVQTGSLQSDFMP